MNRPLPQTVYWLRVSGKGDSQLQPRAKRPIRLPVVLAVCAFLGLTTGLIWVATRHNAADVWANAPFVPAAGSPAEVADIYLAACVANDLLAACAVFAVPEEMNEADLAQMLSLGLQNIGGMKRFLVLGQDSAPDGEGGELAIVWAVAETGQAGDILLNVYLERPKGAENWLVTKTQGRPVGPEGFVRPPAVDPQEEPLATTADRSRPLQEYEDTLLKAAFGPTSDAAMSIIVSAKIELAFVVAGLTGLDPEFGGFDSPLGSDALRYFRDYRDHEAVAAMSFLYQNGLSYDAVPKFASCFSDPPALEQVFPFGDYLCSRTYGITRSEREARLLDLGECLREFYVDTHFGAYLQDHQGDYDRMSGTIEAFIPHSVPETLESYYGTGHSAYVVVVSAFSGNYALTLEDGNRSSAVAVISGSLAKTSDVGYYLWRLLIHEWSHTLVKPGLDAKGELIASYADLYPAIAGDMRKQAYGSWRSALEEHIIRAAQARMVLARQGPVEAERALADEENRGFRYIRLLYDRLAEYEDNRQAYPVFADFIPRLLSALDGA